MVTFTATPRRAVLSPSAFAAAALLVFALNAAAASTSSAGRRDGLQCQDIRARGLENRGTAGPSGRGLPLRLKGGENFLDRLDRAVTNYVFGCFTGARADLPDQANATGAAAKEEEKRVEAGFLDRLDARVTNYVYSFFSSSAAERADVANGTEEKEEVKEEAGWFLDRLDARVTNYVYSFFSSSTAEGADVANVTACTVANQSVSTSDTSAAHADLPSGAEDMTKDASEPGKANSKREIQDPMAEMLLRQARAMQADNKPTASSTESSNTAAACLHQQSAATSRPAENLNKVRHSNACGCRGGMAALTR